MILCSFGIEPCLLLVVPLLLPNLVSSLSVVGVVVVVVMEAERFPSCCSPTVNFGGSSILDCTCWRRGFLAFDSC